MVINGRPKEAAVSSVEAMKIEITLEEVMALIEYHDKMSAIYPKTSYDKMTAAKITVRECVERRQKRIRELILIKDDNWVK